LQADISTYLNSYFGIFCEGSTQDLQYWRPIFPPSCPTRGIWLSLQMTQWISRKKEKLPSWNLKLREVFRGLATEQWRLNLQRLCSSRLADPCHHLHRLPNQTNVFRIFSPCRINARNGERSKKYYSLHSSLIYSSNRSFSARTWHPSHPPRRQRQRPLFGAPPEALHADDKRRVGARRPLRVHVDHLTKRKLR
jgi:hypothetical protein